MTVTLTASKTISGASPADVLTGGSSGYNWGQSQTGVVATTQDLYLYHDGGARITNLAINAQAMSGTYGGDYSAGADLTKLATHGDSDYGLQIDFDWDAATPFSSFVQIKSGVGVSYASRYTIPVEAMSRNNAGTEVVSTAPIAGVIGATGDTALGDRAHFRLRYMAPSAETQTGKRQFDLYYSFNFTS